MARTIHPTTSSRSSIQDEADLESRASHTQSLRTQIAALTDVLIDARLRLAGPDALTREDAIFDLYDEELISKKDAIERSGIDRSVFFDKLFSRRDARAAIHAEE